MNLRLVAAKVRRSLCLGFALCAACVGLTLGWSFDASAAPLLADLSRNPIEKGLDSVAGAGTANQLKGQAREDLGTVQRQVDKTTSQIEGATNQVQGRAQKDIGRTQDAAEDAADAVQDSAEGFVDSVKDLFTK